MFGDFFVSESLNLIIIIPLFLFYSLSFFFIIPRQRPTAKELLKHKLIVRYAKKTSYLTELIDRYKRWKAEQSRAESSSDESDSYVT